MTDRGKERFNYLLERKKLRQNKTAVIFSTYGHYCVTFYSVLKTKIFLKNYDSKFIIPHNFSQSIYI